MSYEFNRNDVYGFARTISTDVKKKAMSCFLNIVPIVMAEERTKKPFLLIWIMVLLNVFDRHVQNKDIL